MTNVPHVDLRYCAECLNIVVGNVAAYHQRELFEQRIRTPSEGNATVHCDEINHKLFIAVTIRTLGKRNRHYYYGRISVPMHVVASCVHYKNANCLWEQAYKALDTLLEEMFPKKMNKPRKD